MNSKYEDLAARAAQGDLTIKPGTTVRGTGAAEQARALLLEATGTTSTEELTRVALGRPALGASSGASPVVRARVPQALKDRVIALAEREHRNESDVVRDALAAYVQAKAVS